MTFKDWIYSRYPNPCIQNQWGLGHIATLLSCIAIIVLLALVFRKNEKGKKITVYVLTGLILTFEILRRILNATRPLVYGGQVGDFRAWLYLILPRPWCAISCWLIIASPIVRKKWLYNLSSMCAIICALIFFAYPSVGFNNQYMLFENVYSIGTHSLLLITATTLITFNFTDFRYVRDKKWTKTAIIELIGIVGVFIYATLLIVFKIEGDPLYFMPGNDVMKILGFSYPLFIIVYALFLILYFNLFYLVPKLVAKIKRKA